MPQKVNMTKKIRLPQANSREVIGKGNNKRNDKNKSRNDQAKLNYIANNTGQTPTPDGLLTLDGFLYLYSICQNARLVDPPKQQTVIKKNAPAFEANTRIDVRRNGNQTRIHSFVSTSTINRERIQSLNTPPTMPHQSTSIALPFISASPFFTNQTFPHQTSTSAPQDIDIAKRAHELSLSVHQRIHNIYQLLNCSTTRRTDQVNTYVIGGESVEQTSIQTICQEAVGQAERRNDQGVKQESELFSPPNNIIRTDQGTYSFSAEEAAQKLSKSFQATYKNKQNVPVDDPNVHNQVTETFWKGLTDLFYQFFSQHEQMAYTQEQKETSGSFMSNFVDWLQSTFSVNYGEQIPNHNQTAQYRQIPMTTHPTDYSLPTQTSQKKSKKKMPENNPQELASETIPQSVGETASILSLKEEKFLFPFWHLAADFYGRVDGYIQYFNFDIFPNLVAEARPIIPTDVEETEEILLGYEKLSASTVLKINRIMTEYLDRQPLTVSNKEPFPPFWSDQETFQLRHKIEVVNQEVKKYLCDQGVPCDGLSGVELLEAVENWVEKDGDETKKNRKIRLAQVIRKASGLQNRDLKYTKAAHILLQWKNNNIFKDYQFKELEQQPISEIPTTIEGNTVTNQNNETIQSTTPLPSVEINPQLQCSEFLSTETRLKLNHVLNLYINGSMFNKELQESIPKNLAPFWYDLELFEKRDQTDKVNNDVKALICKQGQKCRNKVMTGQSLFLEIRDWEKSKDAQTVRINRKNVARNILKSSGLFTRSLNAEGVELILFQWINNNIFKDYKFKDIRKTHAKTTEELNESQSSTPTPITSVTIALTTGEFSKGTQTKLAVTEMPIFTTRFDEALLKSYEILSDDTIANIKQLTTEYLKGQSSDLSKTKSFPPFWYDPEIFKLRSKTPDVNQKIKDYLCEKGVSCKGLSGLKLINAVEAWVTTNRLIKPLRRKHLAHIIREASGLESRDDLPDKKITNIYLQWKNNNIFQGYIFKDQQLATPKELLMTDATTILDENQLNTEMTVGTDRTQLTTESAQEVDIDNHQLHFEIRTKRGPVQDLPNSNTPMLKSYKKLTPDEIRKINNIISNFLGEHSSSKPTSEELPPFWYDEVLYQKRSETEKVNELVRETICDGKSSCSYTTNRELLLASQNWIHEDKKLALNRMKLLAVRILEASGLSGEAMSETRASTILLQWQDNNIFRNVKFKAVDQATLIINPSRNETIIENTEVVGTTIHLIANSYGPIPQEALITTNHIRKAYLDGRPSLVDTSVPLIPIWYDFELYQKRGRTDKANEAVENFLCDQGVNCGALTNQQLVLTANEWAKKVPTDAEILEKKKELAPIILEAYGIADRNITDTSALNAVFQWENNNALDEYTWIKPKQLEFEAIKSQNGSLEITDELKEVSPNTVDPDLVQVQKTVVYLINDMVHLPSSQEALPIFYYDYELFQKRSKTNDVNKMLKEFLIKEGIEIKELSESELAEGIRKWIEKADPNEAFDKSGRRQYLAYLLLNTYGVENVRLGEFMPFDKMNAIFMQWKINALLEGYLYEEITKETIHHYIGKTEHYLVTYFKQQKKSSKQIYDDFIHDRPATVSKENPLPLIYVHYNLFKNREETSTANRAVRRFLTGKGVSFINRSKSELVRKLKEWIFKGETYTEIVAREKEIAKLIRKAYGLIDKDIAINKARNVLIQWVNNNAQLGYTYKENDNFEEEPQLSQRIKTFIRDNGENIFQNRTIDTMEKEKPKLDNTQRLIAFLIENGVKTEDTTPEKLGKTVADWGLLKGATQETLNMVRVKQLAQVLLGKPLDGVISETQATTIVADWLSETLGNRTSAPQVEDEKQQTITSTPSSVTREKVKYKGIQWQDSKVMNQIEQLFRQEGLLTGNVTKETILIAMGKWFTQEGSGMVLSYTKLQKLAKTILKELNLYGGGDKETISDRDAKLTITKWVFENVLGCPIEMYMIKQILDSPNPSQFTIGSLRKLFEVDDLRIAGRIVLHVLSIPEGGEAVFKKLWTLLLEEALPNYFLETSALSDDLLISDYGSLVQLIGTKLLVDEGIQTQYNQEEIRTIGSFFLEEAIKNEVVNFDELHYILIPALLSVSQLEPVLLRKALEEGNYREVALQTFIRYWQKGNIQIMENQRMFNQVFDLYQESILKWRRKKVLAEEEAKKCIGQGTKTSALVLEQRYLGGSDPCPDYFTSPNIEDVYKTLTRAVSDSFYPFDKKLIEYATNSFDATESQFIFSPETHTYLAHAKLESKPGVPGRGTAPPFSAAYLNQQVVIELSQCDLFVAVQGNEERWYALKKLEEDGGYSYYRVDKDPLLYLKFGLFDQTEIKGKGYKIEGDSIRIGIRLYTFSVRMDQSKKLSHGDEKEKFIDTLSLQHSEALYTQLYRSGDDKTIAQQTWDILKHFIPFYDCVTGIAEQDAAKAVPSCLIDVVLLIPVLGQITALNTRFALGVARAIATGGIRNGIRKGVQFAPNIFELKKVLYSTLRYMDPGFGLVAGGSKLLLKGLVKLKNQVYITKEVKVVLEKLSKSISSPDLPSGMVKAKLPDGGSEIVVKLVKHHLYASVTDLKTGTVSGRYFVLKGDHLEPFSGSVTFTSEQQALIDRLAIKTNNPSQIIVTEPNVNPRAYGEGPVWTLAYGEGTEMKVDKEEAGAEYFVQMNQKLVPIRITAIEGHGVRFDVVEGEKIHPVNYNGIEWYFEGKTSPFISKELAEEVGKKIDDFESIEDPSTLSPPYERDLMSNENGRTYIKINDHYIPLILFDKNNGRYHLVKKDIDEPMMVLRFDPDSGGFTMETVKEKEELKISIREEIIQRKGKAQSKWKSGSSTDKDSSAATSQGSSGTSHEAGPGTSQVGPSTSTGAIPKVFSHPVDIPTIDFPESPNNWEMWKDFKKAEPLPDRITIEEDANIDLTKLSEFPPSWEAYYKTGEDSIRQNVYKAIDVSFPRPIPQLEVFTGLDSTRMPNFLKPFFGQLRDDFEAAERRFNAAVLLFKSLWKMEDISSMEEGKYLIEMFKLQGVPKAETEEILRESIRKLYTTAEHGKMFLQKSKDLFFQNVWTLSSKLIYDREALSYYSSIQDIIRSEAFTVKYDGECRIFILADAFHLDPKVLPEAHIQPTGYETVMHEVTHIMSDAEDLLQYGLVRRGLRKNGKRTLDYYDNKYPNVTKEDSIQMKYYRDYLAKVLSSPNLTVKKIIEALEVNHTLRVHFQLTDAEMLMTILRDLVEGRAFDAIFRAKRESDQEQDGKKSDSLETIKEQLGTGDLFTLQALIYTIGFINFEREFQQSKTQEKTIDIPESTSTKTTNSPTTGNRNKREIVSTTIESAESITNQSLLKLINQSIERSNNPDYSVSDQSVSTDLPEKVSKRRALNHVTTNIENNPNHFISDPQIIIGIPKDTEKKSFLDIVFTSRNRSAQKNPTKGFNRPINKNQKILAPQH